MDDDKPVFQPEQLPEHVSGLRQMVAEEDGLAPQSFHSLAAAKAQIDGTVILAGDDCGQIYIVCPASMVQCKPAILEQLLSDLDGVAWPGNDAYSRHIFYEGHEVGAPIVGGMGGASREDDIWIHQTFVDLKLGAAIRAVIEGRRERIR